MVLLKSNFREGYVLATNNIAVFFVEHVVQSIKPRGFEGVKGLDGITDFIISQGESMELYLSSEVFSTIIDVFLLDLLCLVV